MRLGGLAACFVAFACSMSPAPDQPASDWAGGSGVAGEPAAGRAVGGSASGAGGAAAGAEASSAGDADGGAAGATSPVAGSEFDPALRAACSGTKPITCALPAPNGNYDVTLDLGSDDSSGSSRVLAETRHDHGSFETVAGEHRLLDSTVNVRAELHDGGQSAPGDVLELLIEGVAPELRGLRLRAAPQARTLFIAGDSTVCDWLGSNASAVSDDETGWGQALAQYFGAGIAVANYADSGETSGSFYGKFFPALRAAMKAGDYLLIQFGHNDQKDDAAIAAYRANLLKYVSDARARQVTPILLTPVSRASGSDAEPGFAGLDQQVRDLCEAEQLALIDLTVLSRKYYATVPDKKLLFVDGGTHLSSAGAGAVAGIVATALRTFVE
jgi:lysophospholipase L1-like esterase